MATQEVKRKLACILSADVEGYNHLMGEDEKETVRNLNSSLGFLFFSQPILRPSPSPSAVVLMLKVP